MFKGCYTVLLLITLASFWKPDFCFFFFFTVIVNLRTQHDKSTSISVKKITPSGIFFKLISLC